MQPLVLAPTLLLLVEMVMLVVFIELLPSSNGPQEKFAVLQHAVGKGGSSVQNHTGTGNSCSFERLLRYMMLLNTPGQWFMGVRLLGKQVGPARHMHTKGKAPSSCNPACCRFMGEADIGVFNMKLAANFVNGITRFRAAACRGMLHSLMRGRCYCYRRLNPL